MIQKVKDYFVSIMNIPNKKELITATIKDTLIITNFLIMAMLPMILFSLGKQLKIEVPDTSFMKAYVNLMTFMSHMTVYSVLITNKELRAKTLVPFIFTELIILFSFNSASNFFGSGNLISTIGSAMCVIILPLNFGVMVTALLVKVIKFYRERISPNNLGVASRSCLRKEE